MSFKGSGTRASSASAMRGCPGTLRGHGRACSGRGTFACAASARATRAAVVRRTCVVGARPRAVQRSHAQRREPRPRTWLGNEAVDAPAVGGAGIAQSILQPVGTALPELDRRDL